MEKQRSLVFFKLKYRKCLGFTWLPIKSCYFFNLWNYVNIVTLVLQFLKNRNHGYVKFIDK